MLCLCMEKLSKVRQAEYYSTKSLSFTYFTGRRINLSDRHIHSFDGDQESFDARFQVCCISARMESSRDFFPFYGDNHGFDNVRESLFLSVCRLLWSRSIFRCCVSNLVYLSFVGLKFSKKESIIQNPFSGISKLVSLRLISYISVEFSLLVIIQ